MNRFSKIGIIISGIYVIATATVFFYAFTCHGEFCGFVGLIPVIPWVFVMDYISPYLTWLPHLFDVVPLFFFAFVNATVLYLAGKYIEIMFKKLNIPKS